METSAVKYFAIKVRFLIDWRCGYYVIIGNISG